jgi:CHAD domain-containing protein
LRTLADRRGLLSEKDIHQLRVTVKRLRAMWQLVRKIVPEEQYEEARARLKAIHQALGPSRDVTVITETLERLGTKSGDAAARAVFERCVSGMTNELMPTVLAIPIARLSESYQEESRVWRETIFPNDPLEAVLDAYARSYRKGRKLSRRVLEGATGEVLHELRGWAKTTLHQIDLVKSGLGDSNRARRWYLDRLGDTLGAHNDCAMLKEHLPELQLKRRDLECVTEQLAARMRFTHGRVVKLLPHVYTDPPRVFRADLYRDVLGLGLAPGEERRSA